MSSTNQILDKAKALSAPKGKPDESRPKPKRKGVWSSFCEPQIDPGSNVGVVITERIRGKAEYAVSFMHFDRYGANRYIALPLDGEHELEDIVYSLALKAKAIIAERRKTFRQDRPERPKSPRRPKDKKRTPGLSAVVQEDAAKSGKPQPEGKTARKRRKGKR